ncbi:MAG: GAF domain-containing protein [Syntrophomonadaceae bacterium]
MDQSLFNPNDESLLHEKRLFARAFYSSPIMMAIISIKDDCYVEVNQSFLETLELDRESVLGQSPGSFKMWLDDKELDKAKQELIQTRRLELKNSHIRTGSGRIISIQIWAELITIDGGEFCLVNLQDSTEHALAAEKLHLNQRRLEALETLNQMSDASTEEVIEFAYREAIELTKSDIGWLGFVNQDETEMCVSSWSDSGATKCTMSNIKRCYQIAQGGLWAQAIRERRPIIINDYAASYFKTLPLGHVKISRFLIVPIFDRDRIVSVISVANKYEDYDESDINQLRLLIGGLWRNILRRQAEESLRQSEECFSKAFRCNPDLMALSTLNEGLYLEVNDSFLRLTGYERHEVIGRTALDLNIWAFPEQRDYLVKQITEHGSIKDFELQLRGKSGEIRWFSLSGEILNIGGKPHLLNTTRDINEKKRYEKEIARLERLHLVGEMAASIGHEVRNPLTVVRGFLQMLGLREDYARHQSYFTLMIEELDRCNEIITEFLSLAKDKNVDLRPKYLDLIVKALYPIIRSDANHQEINIKLELNKPPAPLIDENEIRQLILNLARNGLESMPPGGTLTIGTGFEDGSIILFVKDEGRGFNPEMLDKIGTPFLTTKENGTGLGLAVCYSIAARHHAKIDVETTPQGTCFTVRFPLPHEE